MEGIRVIRTPQNGTEIHINTAHNNIRKPQTALKLPKYSKPLGFVEPQYHNFTAPKIEQNRINANPK